jgi:hypothetical protein
LTKFILKTQGITWKSLTINHERLKVIVFLPFHLTIGSLALFLALPFTIPLFPSLAKL